MKVFVIAFVWIFLSLSCSSSKEEQFSSKYNQQSLSQVIISQSELPFCASSASCCNADKNCWQTCKKNYVKSRHQETCFELDKEFVYASNSAKKDFFNKPNFKNLEKIDIDQQWEAFVLAVQLSDHFWLSDIYDYSRKEAGNALLWLAVTPSVFQTLERHLSINVISTILVALLRQNNYSDLVDDNAVLSGLKSPIDYTKTYNLFHKIVEYDNRPMIDFIHNKIISKQLCDYSINQPRPDSGVFSDFFQTACILSVYCDITGSYSDKAYKSYILEESSRYTGADIRSWISKEVYSKNITQFIELPVERGGLGIDYNAKNWPDRSCQELSILWNAGNLEIRI